MLKRGSIIGLLVLILVASVLIVSCAKPAPAPTSKPATTTAPPPASKPATTAAPAPAATKPVTASPAATPKPTASAKPSPAAAFPTKPDVKMPQFLRIMGGTTPGTGVDLICEGATQLVREVFPNVAARHWPGTSLEGLGKVQDGIAEMTGATPVSAYEAFTGKGVPKPCTDLRLLFYLPADIKYTLLTLKSRDDIKSPADLWNKRIGTNEKGSQAELSLQEKVLPAYQLSYKSVQDKGGLIYLGPTTTLLSMLASGELDAVWTVPSHPLGAITVLHLERGIKLVELGDAALKSMLSVPGRGATTIPAETYKGIPAYKTVGSGYAMITHKKMADDVVYNVTAACFLNPERWWHFVPTIKGADILATATTDFIIPVHPGAEKYWKTRNMEIKYSSLAVGLGK